MNHEHHTPSLTEAPRRTPEWATEALVAAPGEQISKEIVPLDYGRFAYNALHGTNLEAHKANLTAEQAQQINDNFDIELYFGTHGYGEKHPLRRGMNGAPTQLEYDEAAKAVADLRPGDTLFIEAPGFNKPVVAPLPPVPRRKAIPGTPKGMVGSLAPLSNSGSILDGIRAHQASAASRQQHIKKLRQNLEINRQNYKLSAWEYAVSLARLNGVEVVNADVDAFEASALQATQGKSIPELIVGTPEEKHKARLTLPKRDTQSRNIVKDSALARLSKISSAPNEQPQRKPKLRVLNGAGHMQESVQAYKEMGINAKVVEMQSSSEEARQQEIATYLGSAALPQGIRGRGFDYRSSRSRVGLTREAFRRSMNEDKRKD